VWDFFTQIVENKEKLDEKFFFFFHFVPRATLDEFIMNRRRFKTVIVAEKIYD